MSAVASKKIFSGWFLQSVAMFMFVYFLYRVFCVSMWYHFAFMTICISLFGLIAGIIVVYLYPQKFTAELTQRHLAFHATWLALLSLVCFVIFLFIPVWPVVEPLGLLSISLVYLLFAVPFYFSGVCASLVLTRYVEQISKLYALMLLAFACAALLVILILQFTDCPTAIILVAFLLAAGALLFALETDSLWLRKTAFALCLVFSSWTIAHHALTVNGTPLLHLSWIKGFPATEFLYEKWNCDSFVAVSELGDCWPMGLGLAPRCTQNFKVNQDLLTVDCDAAGTLTNYGGDIKEINFLQCDVTNVCHYLRRNADVFVVGAGGGRDILSALAFKQNSVVAVANNVCLANVLKDRFKDFTGNLAGLKQVSLIVAEPRRYMATNNRHFDIIQSSLCDNLTGSPQDVFSDNTAYTVNAWRLFFAHLKDDGLLSVSCWYRIKDTPAEMYKLTNLASSTLKSIGVSDPRSHILIMANLKPGFTGAQSGVGTIIVSKGPLSDDDLNAAKTLARQLDFAIVLSPKTARNPIFARLAEGDTTNRLLTNLPLNVAAPTDDRPFFFNVLRFADVGFKDLWLQEVSFNVDRKAAFVLYNLLFTVFLLTTISLAGPLMLTQERVTTKGIIPLLSFSCASGFGFALICLSQVEHLQIFLGYPGKGQLILAAILLFACACGGYSTVAITEETLAKTAQRRLWFLVAILICGGIFGFYYVSEFQFVSYPARILISCLTLVPIGFFIGMAFPLGMRFTANNELCPWLLAAFASSLISGFVLSSVIMLYFGISFCFVIGVLFYVLAAVGFAFASEFSA
jgi:hypothetical protein